MQYLKINDEIESYKKRFELKRKIEDMFIKEGYTYIEPSAFESLEDYRDFHRFIKKEAMVKVINGGSDILVLRPDNTSNIIKNLMPRWEENLRLKLFYNSTVYRSSVNSKIKEVKQMGVEYLGESAINADCEILGLALKILKEFNSGFLLEISNSKYVDGLFEEINIEDRKKEDLKDLISKKNKFELFNFIETIELTKAVKECLKNLLSMQGDIFKIAEKARGLFLNEKMQKAIDELLFLKKFIDNEDYSKYVYFDLSLITELSYYDGIIFKGYFPNSFKDIISGGRYDSFTIDFGKKIPAIGFSIYLNELLDGRGDRDGLS